MVRIEAEAEYLFEASWEAVNKVGGINTVLISKAVLMREYYKNYFLIGPYFKSNADVELNEKKPPKEIAEALREMEAIGLKCHFGTWQIKGSPDVILIDSSSFVDRKNDIKRELWDLYRIDSLRSGWDFEEPMLWAWAVGMLLEFLSGTIGKKKMVAHFHEWLAGFALLYLKKINSPIKTVFTTHATILGRTIAGNGFDLYSMLLKMDPDEQAKKLNVEGKFTAERAMALNADVFTTVSEITGIEAEKILGRKPDILVLNGLDVAKFPTIEETSIKHVTCREKVREYLTYHFFPYYIFDLEHNLMFYTVGRYEFKNKGIDLIIDALARVNERLKKENSMRTVSFFFWIPAGVKGVKIELLENKNYYRHIKNYISFNADRILKNIVYEFVSQSKNVTGKIFSKEFIQDLRKDILKFKRQGNPLLVTHNLDDEEHDPIINACKAKGLLNRKEDRVKVIFDPVYLDGNDSLINLTYYDAMAACHLGVFPSYYEPWGYTPLESAAMGVPSVTTDLAGFGRFIETRLPKDNKGIWVIKRYNKSYDESADELAEIMYTFANLPHAVRVQNKINAKVLSNLADWDELIENYIKAHNMALKK